ncbi:putative alcohol dehydrogenase [Violaceomyces palustris]|uniref:Alcohol dehydrogenase n=1 Tax=Violaceomyces palustris TaxID=1673888 RepID=A0ACD0NP64_9BASI|nr:putative alcohol dehydrogenase [Violaceomyces palustris]
MTVSNQAWVLPADKSKRTGFSSLELKNIEIPKVDADQVLIKVKAVALNYRDLIITKNLYPLFLKDDETIAASDGAGEVVEVGSRVSKWKKGDRVAGIFSQGHLKGGFAVTPDETDTGLGGGLDGMLAQYVVLSQEGLVRIPSHLSYEEAACLPCAAVTAYNALYGIPHAQLRSGQTVALQGTGGVSVFGLQLAVAAGAKAVITSSSDEKLAKVLSLIPESQRHLVTTVNYKTNPDWDEEVIKASKGKGADHVIEVGGPGTLEKSLKAARYGGVISNIGFVAPGKVPDITGPVLIKNLIFRGVLIGSREQFEDLNQVFEDHKIRPAVDKVFEFKDAVKAYEYQWSQAHVGKVVIRVD